VLAHFIVRKPLTGDHRDPLTILHVTAPAQVGGLERVVQGLATGQAQRGHAVHVAAILDPGASADAFLLPMERFGVTVHRIVVPSRSYFRERQSMRAVYETVSPGVVHTHGYRTDVIAGGVAQRLGLPTVTTVHGFTGGSWKNRLYEWLQVRAFRGFDAVVAVSPLLAAQLRQRGVGDTRVKLIVNAWTQTGEPATREVARRELGIATDAVTVGWVGRTTREKGADVLIAAIPRLPPGIGVSIIGDGAERSRLESMARSLGVAERVRWHGLVHDAGSLLRAFDVFVLSSRTEGTPIVLLEAMSAAVPIVATRVGGVPNVVSEREAVLVPSENPAALAAAIEQVVRDPAKANARASAAEARLAAGFGAEPWLRQYEELYTSIVNTEH
jgi:glycosyltransferase involved in cell wall biosynthesis